MSEDLQALLEERARLLAQPPEQARSQQTLELLRLHLGPHQYALRAAYIDEVVPWAEGTRVPGAPAWVLGVMARRGMIVTVIDLSARLGHGPGACQQVIVLSSGERKLGLGISQIDEVVSLPDRLHALSSEISSQRSPLLEGTLEDGSVLLNGPALLDPEALRAF